MTTTQLLDRKPPFVIICPECGNQDVKLLRHWSDRPRKETVPTFDPTHQCERCGFRWIYRSPKEKIRSLLMDN